MQQDQDHRSCDEHFSDRQSRWRWAGKNGEKHRTARPDHGAQEHLGLGMAMKCDPGEANDTGQKHRDRQDGIARGPVRSHQEQCESPVEQRRRRRMAAGTVDVTVSPVPAAGEEDDLQGPKNAKRPNPHSDPGQGATLPAGHCKGNSHDDAERQYQPLVGEVRQKPHVRRYATVPKANRVIVNKTICSARTAIATLRRLRPGSWWTRHPAPAAAHASPGSHRRLRPPARFHAAPARQPLA